jgi:hypothetical protein
VRMIFVFATGLFFGWLIANYTEPPKEVVRANLADLYHSLTRSP